MNDHDQLEQELAALVPVVPSPQLQLRIARRLEDGQVNGGGSARGASGPRFLWLAASGSLAACLAVYILWRSEQPPINAPEPLPFRTEATTRAAFDARLPSVWSYRQALGRSAADLDALLNRHSENSAKQSPPSQRAGSVAASASLSVSVFARSDSQLKTLLGEL